MSTLIEKQFDFQAGIFFQNTFLMNIYDFTLVMEVNTDSIREQNIAMDRIKYLIYECFENVVFISDADKKLITKFEDCGIKSCILSQEPYDQIIALALLLKFNAVCEGRIKMLEIRFTSKLSDGVIFTEDIEIAKKTFDSNGWWYDTSPSIDFSTPNKREKIVKLIKDNWTNVGLTWKPNNTESTEIIFNMDSEK